MTSPDPIDDFIEAASVPRQGSHASGALTRAEALRAAHPQIADASIHACAILGDEAGLRRHLAREPALATAKGGPWDWDALTYLCFSRYLKLDRARSDAFVRTATALLDAGASATTGWWEPDHQPSAEWESALYGAAGIAHDAALTRLLLALGADPNDGETVYHTPETYDNDAMKALVETGRLSEESRALLLIRKHDWHDEEGAAWLLEHGVDPNASWNGFVPLHHALMRDNSLDMIAMLLDHGADPARRVHGMSGVARAARAGRGDVLALFRARGIAFDLAGADALLAACAENDTTAVRTRAAEDPAAVREIVTTAGPLLAAFAGTGNTAGVAHLLDLGIDVATRLFQGDGYWDIASGSTALHVAAWRGRHDTVEMLLARGAPVHARDASGRTALALAVRATVDSYWTARRAPDSVAALLHAGARASEISRPTGYAAVDELLAAAEDVEGRGT